MNAGTCWGKNTIGPRGRSVEKAPGSDFTWGTEYHGGITHRVTGRGLLSAFLSSGEQKEPYIAIRMVCIFNWHLQGRKVYC
jgi:hypothetical protein